MHNYLIFGKGGEKAKNVEQAHNYLMLCEENGGLATLEKLSAMQHTISIDFSTWVEEVSSRKRR